MALTTEEQAVIDRVTSARYGTGDVPGDPTTDELILLAAAVGELSTSQEVVTNWGLAESIPEKDSIKLCLEYPYGIQTGSVDGNPQYVYFWESKLGLPDRLDFEYPRIASGNRALCASRQNSSVVGSAVRFGAVGVKAEYLYSTWTPAADRVHAMVWLMHYANTSQQASIFTYSDSSYFAQHGTFVGVAYKAPGQNAGYGQIAGGIQSNKAYVCHLQYDPVNANGSHFWINGVEMSYDAPLNLTGMPAIDRLIIGGPGDFYIKGMWGYDGTVDPTDMFDYVKAFATSQGVTI